MKRIINYFFLLSFLSFSLLSMATPVRADSEAIYSIDVIVDLQNDASANITQIWHVSSYQGTEIYIPQTNLGDREITNLQVSDDSGNQFEYIGDWDVDASFEEKANKVGLNQTSDGVEICWGKAHGENTYTLNYTMTNFIREYADGAFGFNSRFVNDNLDPAPQRVSVTIQQAGSEFSAENAGIWGFGFTNKTEFTDDGKVVAINDEPFIPGNNVTILMRLDQSLVTNAAPDDSTFDEVMEAALIGSDYNSDEAYDNAYEEPTSVWNDILAFLSTALPFTLLWVFIVRYKKAGDKNIAPPIDEKNLAYYRDIPYKGYLPAAFYILDNYGKLGNKSDLISAYFLRWIKLGAVTVEKCPKKSFLGIGSKNATSLVFQNEPNNAGKLEQALYDIMIKAAGSDNILQENELRTWSSANYSTLSAWFDRAEQSGENYYKQNQLLTTVQQPYVFNILKRTVTAVNDTGLQENKNLFGFKKYLQDYTLIKDRTPNEVQLWDEYLVFASLFGIADQVAKDFKKINPQFFEASEYQQSGGGYDFFTTYMFLNVMSNASYQGMDAGRYSSSDTRSGGGGGFSSFGGGGGFSGGGSGGGFR